MISGRSGNSATARSSACEIVIGRQIGCRPSRACLRWGGVSIGERTASSCRNRYSCKQTFVLQYHRSDGSVNLTKCCSVYRRAALMDKVGEQISPSSDTRIARSGRCESEGKTSFATDGLYPVRVKGPIGLWSVRAPLCKIVVQILSEVLDLLLDPSRQGEPIGQKQIVTAVELSTPHICLLPEAVVCLQNLESSTLRARPVDANKHLF